MVQMGVVLLVDWQSTECWLPCRPWSFASKGLKTLESRFPPSDILILQRSQESSHWENVFHLIFLEWRHIQVADLITKGLLAAPNHLIKTLFGDQNNRNRQKCRICLLFIFLKKSIKHFRSLIGDSWESHLIEQGPILSDRRTALNQKNRNQQISYLSRKLCLSNYLIVVHEVHSMNTLMPSTQSFVSK